jgi:inhibitor of cysteine peptidase
MRSNLSAVPLLFLATVILLLAAIAAVHVLNPASTGGHQSVPPIVTGELKRYSSGSDLLASFADAATYGRIFWTRDYAPVMSGAQGTVLTANAAPRVKEASADYSTTNVQVAGVDEGDVVKSDGTYIYLVSGSKVIITRAYPAADASVVCSIEFTKTSPREIFIDGDRLLVFGTSSGGIMPMSVEGGMMKESIMPWYGSSTTVIDLYDISDRASPKKLTSFEVEGDYLTSRLIGDYAYFVVNSYPRVYIIDENTEASDIIPLVQEPDGTVAPIASPTDIGYVPGIRASSFITIASVSLKDAGRNITTQTIAGSGQNVYASQDNLYVTEYTGPCYYPLLAENSVPTENTTVLKFDPEDGNIASAGTASVKGHVLNQFFMDEYNGFFRIATTLGQVWDTTPQAKNNVYVLDSGMKQVGALEDLAPGEEIYSCRFMGDRCYLVTFKKVDPLFVIDLSNPSDPQVLGKLKIPGYSDYLHPYDATHLIGIGKDAEDADQSLIESRGLDFAWYQGVKMAIFDVSDVANPKELFKATIGDRGTDSPVLTDHRAFLFDNEKGLLVLPITLAQITGERTSADQYGECVFQGAYVYDVNLQSGFALRGRVTQYNDSDAFLKSGYYFYGDRSITRSLYINNVLYTLSDTRLQLNDLTTLEWIKTLDLQSLTIATPGPTIAPTPAPHHVAYFTSNVTGGTVPLAVQFTDASTGSPTGWQWSWGDLTTNDTVRNPVHVFSATGLYTIMLTVTNANGSNMTAKAGYINVTAT